jgi:hypothetical protein
VKKSLGNVDPTVAERKRMLAALEGLRKRLNEHGNDFGPATFNTEEGTGELRWAGDGGRPWVTAWISEVGAKRSLLIWRHPSYRYRRDDQYLYDASETRNLGGS